MNEMNVESIKKLATYKMPYGKYRGINLIDLPEPYVIWFHENRKSSGEFGNLMAELFEIKVNGLESMVRKVARLS